MIILWKLKPRPLSGRTSIVPPIGRMKQTKKSGNKEALDALLELQWSASIRVLPCAHPPQSPPCVRCSEMIIGISGALLPAATSVVVESSMVHYALYLMRGSLAPKMVLSFQRAVVCCCSWSVFRSKSILVRSELLHRFCL